MVQQHVDAMANQQTGDRQPTGARRNGGAEQSWPPGAQNLLAQGMAQLDRGQDTAAVRTARCALVLEPASPEGLFLLGVAVGRLGQTGGALRHFLAAIRLRPDFVEAHLNVGHLLETVGRFDPAIRSYRVAAKLRPQSADVWAMLGNAYRRSNRLAEAVVCFQEALRLRAADPDTWTILGVTMQMLDRTADACTCYEASLRFRPEDGGVRNSLGLLRRAAGDGAGARACFTGLLASAPGDVPAMLNLALVEFEAGRADRALLWCRRALALEPRRAEAWNRMGNALKAGGSMERATAAWRTALTLDPVLPDALGNLGGARCDQNRFAEAGDLLRRALALAPQHAALHGVLAHTLSGQGRTAEAERACRRSLALAPAQSDPLCTLGLVEQRQGRAGSARWFDRAIAVTPVHALARFNCGLFDLERGALTNGWANYSYRFAAGRAARERRFTIPEWRGEPLAGKRLFIWREQGVGDEFLFASCYADAIRQADRVIIECERRLVPLFARSFPRAIVRAEQPVCGHGLVETVDCDYHIAAGSLPRHLRGSLGAFPMRSAWLHPDAALVADWRQRLDAIGGALRVGIAWRSQLMTIERQWSYVLLKDWGPVFAVPGVTFVNLQYDDCRPEIERAQARFGVPVHEMRGLDLKDDFDNTAALVANLDLVIAPANSVAEFAGALNVPVWRFGHRDWTHLGSAVRPWYPSMRVFHPTPDGGLPGALGRIAEELRRVAAIARAESGGQAECGARSRGRASNGTAGACGPKPH